MFSFKWLKNACVDVIKERTIWDEKIITFKFDRTIIDYPKLEAILGEWLMSIEDQLLYDDNLINGKGQI